MREQRVLGGEPGRRQDVLDLSGAARLRHVAEEARARARPRADGLCGPLTGSGHHDQLVAHERADDGGVGSEQLTRRDRDLLRHALGREAGDEARADRREVVRQHAPPPFGLVQLAALERAARRVAEMAGDGEIVVGELVVGLEDDDDRGEVALSAGDRRGAKRCVAALGEELPRGRIEPVVVAERAHHHPALAARVGEWRLRGRYALGQRRGQLGRQLVGAGEPEQRAGGLEHERRVAAERLRGRARERVERLAERERRAEHLGDPEEPELDARLALVVGEEPGNVDRNADLAGNGFGDRDVVGRPRTGVSAVKREDADLLVEDENGGCECGLRPESCECCAPPERLVIQRRRVLDVADRDRAALSEREVRHREPLRHGRPDRLDPRRGPFGADGSSLG